MIEILIVDDDGEKTARVSEFISGVLGGAPHRITTASSVAHAAACLEAQSFALLVLDLMLPMRWGDEPRRDAGIAVIDALTRQGERYRRPTHVVGLTGHGELQESHRARFEEQLWYLLRYDASSNEWEVRLASLLVHILAAQRTISHGYKRDLAIITALHTIELENVLKLPGDWCVEPVEGDDTIYHSGVFRRGDKEVTVIAAAALEMGMPALACLASKVISTFRPRYLGVCGIAAGVKGQFGDVLIASHSWDYGSGKHADGPEGRSLFQPAPSQLPLEPLMNAKAQLFAMRRDIPPQICERWGTEVSTFEVKIGHVASGAAVVAHRDLIEELVRANRKLVGVEMEIYGAYMAAGVAPEPKPLAIAMKSICDYGDGDKNDEHQDFAAFTSAQYLYEFALDQLA